MELKRRIISLLLLAVFVPAVFASSLHRHHHVSEEAAVECVDCHHHSGHLISAVQGIDDCVLCHFLGLSFIVALDATLLPPASRLNAFYGVLRQAVPAAGPRHNRSRAPPVPVLSF